MNQPKRTITLAFLLTCLLSFFSPLGFSCTLVENNPKEPNYGITVFTTAWCPYCKKTVALLNNLNVNYTNCDIEKSTTAYEKYRAVGGNGVPLILIGNLKIDGYEPELIRTSIQKLR